ncbi:MAG: sensor histidine kinase, partial [Chloroflexi bacterium]|nr:sensor histidine kinase [Chloroflexota bacterium]
MRWKWLLACLPAALGVMLAIILTNGALANPILYLRADLASLVALAGTLGSVLVVAWLLVGQRWEQALNRTATEAKAQAADDRRRFLRRLDHELKNPLTAIRAGLANLAEAPSKEAHKEALGSIEAQTLRLSRLLADLRKLADLETVELEQTSVDLAGLLHEAVAAIQEWA